MASTENERERLLRGTEFKSLISQSTTSNFRNYSSLPTNDSFTSNTSTPVTNSTLRRSLFSSDALKQIVQDQELRQKFFIYAAATLLILGTATERVSFKIMVDRMLPYKFVLVQIIFLFSSFLFAILTRLEENFTKEISDSMRIYPHTKIFVMAVVDTVPFLGMAFSASGVPPTMTVILMHASTIFVVLGSRFVFPQRHYSRNNYFGIGLIAASIFMCFLKVFLYRMVLVSSNSTSEVTMSCITFFVATSMHGLATLYKEKCIIEWKRPIDNFYLSAWLFFYQFVVTLFAAVLFYLGCAILGMDTFISMFTNVVHGWKCFFGVDSAGALHDEGYVDCSESMGVIVGYVIASALVVVCMSTVLQLSHKSVGRATEAAIFVAFFVLWIYDVHINDSSFIGGNEGLLDIVAIFLLVIGMETYDHDPEPDVEVITNQLSLAQLSTIDAPNSSA